MNSIDQYTILSGVLLWYPCIRLSASCAWSDIIRSSDMRDFLIVLSLDCRRVNLGDLLSVATRDGTET